MSSNKKTIGILICALAAAGILLVVGSKAKADSVFGTPENLGSTVNSSAWDNDPIVSADGLSLFFDSRRPGGYGGFDVWVTTRETVQDSWGQPVNLGPPVNSASNEASGGISPDGLKFYFISNRPGGLGSYDIWVTTRTTIQDPWSDPVNLGSTINSSAGDLGGRISADGLEFYFNSNRPGGSGGYDIWVATRDTMQAPWGDPVNLGSTVNSVVWDYSPALSPDGLKLLFSSNRSSEYGDWTIWITERATREDNWAAPVDLGPAVNSSTAQENPYISNDGSTLYFGSTRPGGSGYVDLWQVPILPIVDFNGDGIVDAHDMCILVDNWQTEDSICDIGPTPLGDGTVDVHDLTVLAGYFFQEIDDRTLVTHWPLDETEGMVVTDTAGNSNGYAIGNPIWLPDGGRVNGALEFDGIDDFISAPAPLNPADRPFSVLAWVKGGAAGQGIISEAGGLGWLSLDSQTGHLMTELTEDGRSGGPLLSETTITDGNWHRICFVWDGTNRTLYVDSVVVAQDTQNSLKSPGNGVYIGCGDPMQPSTFFSGMIDDVRIYNRVVRP